MRIFLYEFVTGGGWYSVGDEPCPNSLLAEARAMVLSLAADLAAIDGISVTLLQDVRTPPFDLDGVEIVAVHSRMAELAALNKAAAQADATVVIAPEFSGFLAQRIAIVTKSGSRVIAPSLKTIRLASDKHATAEHLAMHGIASPPGVALEKDETLPITFPYPAVLKPRDGAGSQNTHVVYDASDADTVSVPSRLEKLIPGIAASVAFLCGPRGNMALVPCRQHLSDDGRFAYLGGSLPLSENLVHRAADLATRALATLGPLMGFMGVDLVLGEASDGSEDVVIEINPRLTTSYVGLRAAAQSNLAAAMLHVADGHDAHVQFSNRPVQFKANGDISF